MAAARGVATLPATHEILESLIEVGVIQGPMSGVRQPEVVTPTVFVTPGVQAESGTTPILARLVPAAAVDDDISRA